MKLRLFHKFLAVMVLVSALPMALLGLRLISLGQLGVRTAILELHLAQADKIAADFNSYIRSADAALRSAGAAMAGMDWENKQVLLTSLLETRRELKEISVLSKEGKEVVKILTPYGGGGEALKAYASLPDFKKALKGKRAVSLADKGKTAVFYYPFGKDMALRAELDMASFIDSLDLKMLGTKGFPLILDSSASPIAWPRDLPPADAARASAWRVSRDAVKALSSASVEFTDQSDQALLGGYAPISEIGGAVIVVQPLEGAYRYAMFLKRQAVYAVLLFLALSFAAAWVLTRSLAKPINELARAAERVAAGDFTRRAEVETSDELKDLADTFNTMVGQLKTYSDMQLDRIIREQKNTEAILFSTEDGIVMTDLEGRVQLVNRKARSVLGLGTEAPVEGRTLKELIADQVISEAVLDVFTSRKENYFREMEVELEHSHRVFRSFSTPITAPGHAEPIGRLVAFNDITLDKELARIKDEFLHSITHDLRNPMGAIKGFVEFLVKEIPGPVNAAQKKMLISIDRASFRLLGMINNILDVAKMDAGKMEVKLAPVNLRDVAARVIELMESLGQRKHLRFELEGDAEAVLDADGGLMERMFTNLVGNAIKFTPENGVITIGMTGGDKTVTAWVRDTGDGIPPEYLAKVFEKFEQVKGQKAGGTGLGLTICKYAAAVHLGKIWAESEPGRGAKFIFSIPRNLVADESGAVRVRETV
ncbi:MAG TPA: ATP-binding protein [Elusimicrobiales bacterium]|nr:ATP-binding protein [Elusimicrobiales bacterium]